MKVPKVRLRGPDGRPTGETRRPAKLAFDNVGNIVDTATGNGAAPVLPPGFRWLEHDDVTDEYRVEHQLPPAPQPPKARRPRTPGTKRVRLRGW